MADIAAGDIVYTLQSEKRIASRYVATFKIAFGNGALTYPSGGLPLTKGTLGCPNVIEKLSIFDNSDGDGYTYKYNYEAEKIRIWQSPARSHAHDFLVKGGTAAASTDALNIKATVIGKEAATDATNLAADVATKGGVQSATLAAAAGTEVTAASFAPAATVLYVEVMGW